MSIVFLNAAQMKSKKLVRQFISGGHTVVLSKKVPTNINGFIKHTIKKYKKTYQALGGDTNRIIL